jgi:two-component system NtrC family sensor kinase
MKFKPSAYPSETKKIFLIIRTVLRRLRLVTDTSRETGKGQNSVSSVTSQPRRNGKVEELNRKIHDMEVQLVLREKEVQAKNAEFLRSKKLAAIGTLATGIAHELNNPLNNIQISSQVLARKMGTNCPEMVKKALKDFLSQTERIKRIVTDLLESAREKEPTYGHVNLNALLARTYNLTVRSTDTGTIHFATDSDLESIVISADPEMLKQVFINLFNNALDAMSRKETLSVKLNSRNSAVQITLADTSVGMSAETIEKIFDLFFSTKDQETGLGLAIVFSIIQKHHGSIGVRSKIGERSVFTIELPKEGKAA